MKIKKLFEDAVIPFTATVGSAGHDLSAYLFTNFIEIPPHDHVKVGSGISVEIPSGYFGMLCPRSGLGKCGISLANTIGIIDSDFRGEISVLLKNNNDNHFRLEKGTRMAQLIIVPYISSEIEVVDDLEETVRGSGGFGSTGVK